MQKCLLPITITLLMSVHSTAQRYFAVSSGERSQVNTIFLNPASIGGSEDKFLINIASANLMIDNNLGKISSMGKLTKTFKKNYSGGVRDVFNFSGRTQFNMLAPMAEVRGPGVIYAINEQHSLAFTTRLRFFNQFYKFNKLLFSIGTKSPTQASLSANMKNFKWVANSWSEASFTYGGIFSNNSDYQVKIGVTIRALGGIAYLGMSGKNLDLKLSTGDDSITANNANVEFSSSLTGTDNSLSAQSILGNVFGGGGSGLGGDAGVMYISLLPGESKHNNKHGTPGYKYALSVAINDIGAITYNQIVTTTMLGDGKITTKGLSEAIKTYAGLRDYVSSQGFTTKTSNKADIVYMPTALVAGLDYHIYDGLYANSIFVANMANNAHFGSKFYSQFTLLPHYDTRQLSLGMPVTYNTLTHNIRLGLGARFGSCFFGSDDILMFFKGGQYGSNIYMGGALALGGKAK